MTDIRINDGSEVAPFETEVNFREVAQKPKKCYRKCPRIPCTAVQASVLGSVVVGLVVACIVLDVLKPEDSNDKEYHEDLVLKINNASLTWKAAYNPFASRTPRVVSDSEEWKLKQLFEETRAVKKKYLASVTRLDNTKHRKELMKITDELPKQFDSRLEWPFCTSLHDVRNQGGCGSCWAISAAAVMSDRICIHSNGTQQPRISTHDILSCCKNCSGCHGEQHSMSSFLYWRDEGIVTGGAYGSYEGCKPYPYSSACGLPCTNKFYRSQANKATCVRSCQSLYYSKTYEEDKYFASTVYDLEKIIEDLQQSKDKEVLIKSFLKKPAQNDKYGIDDDFKKKKMETEQTRIEIIKIMKKELMVFGPVQACFLLAEDFQHYKSGVYKTSKWSLGKWVYGHCIKIIGWGHTIDGVMYWLAVNSWGRDWGEYGLFKFHVDETPTEWIAGLP